MSGRAGARAPRARFASGARLLGCALAVAAWAGPGAQASPRAPASGPAPPARVASLNVTADEILVELVAPERLVAVTSFADEPGTSLAYGRAPAAAARFPRADLERLLALRPDLVVLSEYTDPDFLRLVEQSGLRVHRMQGLRSLSGFRAAVLELGDAVGARDAARRLVARYDAVLADLARRLDGAPRPRVLYWSDPMTAGDDTAIGALIEAGGGSNVGRELGVRGVQPIGAERAFVADPDVLLVAQGWLSARAIAEHPLLGGMRAVRSGRVVEMPNELLVTLSHHAADACWWLAHALHPERVAAERPPASLGAPR